jgi:nucleotide-binding universal stress UspA family protein
MKRILLPTDFSDNARNAMEYALNMFGANDMEYIIVNIYAEPYSNTELLVSVDEILEKDSEKGLEEDHAYLKSLFPKESFQIQLWSKYGGLPFEINRICEEEKIDYIVMGTKGASGLKKVLIGSNTADVIKTVKTPVLSIPENIKYITLSQIAFTTDYDSLNDKHALDPLVWIAKEKHSQIKIVNVRAVGEYVG